MTQRRLDVLTEVLEAFNRHDLDAIMAHFAEDCVLETPRGPDPWGRRFVGKSEVRRGLAASLSYLDWFLLSMFGPHPRR